MQLLSIAITLVVVVLVSAMILKKYKPHAILLGGGIVLLLSAQFLGINNIITDVEKSTGFWLFDVFELMRTTLQKDAGATGMVIMAAGAYAMFMNHVGASDVMVKICTKPLKHLGSPYIVLALTYTVGQLLNIFVPSAAGLSVLLMATVYPVLIALGVSHLSAAAVIASAACLDLGPASGASNMAAEMAGLEPMTYFIKYQVPIMAVVIPLVTVTHYLVQKYFDKKDGFVANKNDASAQEDDTTAAGVPKFYALLPLFPLVLLLLFNELVITSIKMNVVTAMMMGVCLTIILEVIRKPKHAFESVKIIDVFFGGMGKQFANIITLIMSGEIFAEGLKRMGMIDLIIEIIRGSKSQKEVKACLTKGDVGNINFKSSDSMIEATKLSFTDKQASAILDLKLYRLIGLEILMLKEEYEEILAKIEEYEDILNNEKSLKNVIRKELDKIKKEFGRERRTVVEDGKEAVYVAFLAT